MYSGPVRGNLPGRPSWTPPQAAVAPPSGAPPVPESSQPNPSPFASVAPRPSNSRDSWVQPLAPAAAVSPFGRSTAVAQGPPTPVPQPVAEDIPEWDPPTDAASVVSIYAPSVESIPPSYAPSAAESELSLGMGSRYSGQIVDLLDMDSTESEATLVGTSVAGARSRSASPTPSTAFEWPTNEWEGAPFDLLGYDPREQSSRWARRGQARSTPVVAEEMVLYEEGAPVSGFRPRWAETQDSPVVPPLAPLNQADLI